VARAYLRPLRGVDEAGEGGRSWPSRSSFRINLLGPEPLPLPLPEARGSEDGVVIVVAAKDTLAAQNVSLLLNLISTCPNGGGGANQASAVISRKRMVARKWTNRPAGHLGGLSKAMASCLCYGAYCVQSTEYEKH